VFVELGRELDAESAAPLDDPAVIDQSCSDEHAMLSLSHVPSPPLGELVESLWLFSDAPGHARERIVPSGTIELVVNLHEDEIRIYDDAETDRCRRFPGAVVSGAYRRSFVIDTREHASIIGVHFKPGGAYPFLGCRADELADAHVDLEALWGRAARELRERLCGAATAAERLRRLEEALIAHRRGGAEPRADVRFAVDALDRGGTSVAAITERVGLSHRRFIEVFSAEVGMTPKLFGRVRRLQRALALSDGDHAPDWTEIALACGYCDQAHLIRDSVELSGFTPVDHRRRRSDRVKQNHVALV
jgi:AraC-like DNA-binding protein